MLFVSIAIKKMGNRFSLCFKRPQTDREEDVHSQNMGKDVVYQTTPFDGQKPGTSGKHSPWLCLTWRFEEEGQGVYAEALHRELCAGLITGVLLYWLQAILEAIPSPGAKGATLVIGGDGRFYNKEVMQIIAKMASANGVYP